MSGHVPVMAGEIIEQLKLKNGNVVVDCTVGCGGHASQVLKEIIPGGMLIGIDQDDEALKIAEQTLRPYGDAFRLIRGNFRDLAQILKNIDVKKVDGLLFDLGVASIHFDTPARGFSVNYNGPLDMRMDRGIQLTARKIINTFPYRELEGVLREYGEEWKSHRIARSIVERRKKKPIETTLELAKLIEGVYYRRRYSRRIHPATKSFLALRVAVNNELDALKMGLVSGIEHLKSGSRISVISFHSLEDRIVKHMFKEYQKKELLRIITKSPLRPEYAEVKKNPRARSAKLRTAERI